LDTRVLTTSLDYTVHNIIKRLDRFRTDLERQDTVCTVVTIGCLKRSRQRVYESHDKVSIKVRIGLWRSGCGIYGFRYELTVIECEQRRITGLDDDLSDI